MTLPADDLIAQEPAPLPAQQPVQPPTQPPAQSPAPNSAKGPTATWEMRHTGEVAIEAPFAIADGPDVLSSAPEKLRNTLTSVKTFKAGGPKQGFLFTITSITYKAGVPVDIDQIDCIYWQPSSQVQHRADQGFRFGRPPRRISWDGCQWSPVLRRIRRSAARSKALGSTDDLPQ
jgi:hypothetical protein